MQDPGIATPGGPKRIRTASPEPLNIMMINASSNEAVVSTKYPRVVTVCFPESPKYNNSCFLRGILSKRGCVSPEGILDAVALASASDGLTSSATLSSDSDGSCKTVRFARCTNANIYPTHSVEDYDRSPIIPACESKSLELPKRKCGNHWLKQYERQRAASQIRREQVTKGPQKIFEMTNESQPMTPPALGNVENPIEGLYGLVSGGYFEGEEREAMRPSSLGRDDGHVSDADSDAGDADLDANENIIEDTGDNEIAFEVMCVMKDTHSNSENESRSDSPTLKDEETSASINHTLSKALFKHITTQAPDLHMFRETRESDSESVDDDDKTKSGYSSDDEQLDEDDDEAHEEETPNKFGICAMGKYSREDVFGTFDSLGGF